MSAPAPLQATHAGQAPRRGVLAPLGVGALAFLLQLPIFDRWMSLMDEGHILQFADLLRRGGELYRDATLIAFPGSFYLLAGLFELFEPSVRVARYAVAVEFALLAMAVFVLLRGWVGGRSLALALALLGLYRIWAFPHWQMYSYSTTALTFIAGALVLVAAVVTRPAERSGHGRLLLAGLLSGIAVACKQDYGGAAVIAFDAVLVLAARTAPPGPPSPLLRQLVAFNGAAAAVGVVMLGHYAWAGLLPEMLRQTIWNHLVGIATFEYSSLPDPWPLFAQDPVIRSTYGFAVYVPSIVFSMDWPRVSASAFYQQTFLWDVAIKALFWGPYLYVSAALLRVVLRRQALRDASERGGALREAALALLAALLVFTLHKPKDWVHMVVMYWPLLVLGAVHFDALARSRPRAARALAATLALPALALVGYTLLLGWKLHDRHDTPLRAERAGGLWVSADEARVVGGAVDHLRERTEPGSRVAVLPYFPLINFLAERDAPHRSTYIFWPLEEVPGRQAQIAAELDAHPEQPVLYHFTQWVQFPDMQSFAPELFAHLVEHYAIDRVFTDDGWGYMLASLERSEALPGEPLLDESLAGTALRIESADGRSRPVAAGERDRWVQRQVWPFRPVLALRPPAGGERSVLSTPLDVPPAGARLATAVGVHPRRWFKFPPSKVTYRVRIVDDGAREEVFARTLDPHPNGTERGWFDVSLPLDRWAGRRVQVEWVTETEREGSAVFEMGGFAWPRVVGPVPPVAGSTP
ncbi:MAG: hypothetical protein ACQGVC_01105 [Myxococcota bacterium]